MITLYECGICDCLHPWSWDGDCRDDNNRYDGIEDFEERAGISEFGEDGRLQIEVRSMDERVAACTWCKQPVSGAAEATRCALCRKPLAHPLEFHPKEACDKWLELTTNGEFDSDSAWRLPASAPAAAMETRVKWRTPACVDCGQPYENRSQHLRPWLSSYHRYNPPRDVKERFAAAAFLVALEEAEEDLRAAIARTDRAEAALAAIEAAAVNQPTTDTEGGVQ